MRTDVEFEHGSRDPRTNVTDDDAKTLVHWVTPGDGDAYRPDLYVMTPGIDTRYPLQARRPCRSTGGSAVSGRRSRREDG